MGMLKWARFAHVSSNLLNHLSICIFLPLSTISKRGTMPQIRNNPKTGTVKIPVPRSNATNAVACRSTCTTGDLRHRSLTSCTLHHLGSDTARVYKHTHHTETVMTIDTYKFENSADKTSLGVPFSRHARNWWPWSGRWAMMLNQLFHLECIRMHLDNLRIVELFLHLSAFILKRIAGFDIMGTFSIITLTGRSHTSQS